MSANAERLADIRERARSYASDLGYRPRLPDKWWHDHQADVSWSDVFWLMGELERLEVEAEQHNRDFELCANQKLDDLSTELRPLKAQLAKKDEALRRISEIIECATPCKPETKCGECGSRHGNSDCTGCIAREALGVRP